MRGGCRRFHATKLFFYGFGKVQGLGRMYPNQPFQATVEYLLDGTNWCPSADSISHRFTRPPPPVFPASINTSLKSRTRHATTEAAAPPTATVPPAAAQQPAPVRCPAPSPPE